MNLNDFYMSYSKYGYADVIDIQCNIDGCTKIETIKKYSAIKNIRKHGMFKCRSHCLSEEGRNKIRKATSYKRSDATKQSMSESANRKWDSEWGVKQKAKLADLAILQNQNKKMDKSKRKVIYISAKNGDLRVCSSSYEYIFCEDFLEIDPTVKSYETQVPYEIEGRKHSLDALIEYIDGTYKIIEVKPKKQINTGKHKQQIEDSRKNAEIKGIPFELLTEKELGIKNAKLATARADEYRRVHYIIDYAAYRQQKDRDKSNRHYANKISQDKVMIYCDFCKSYHSRLRHQYEANVAKNGRFICIKENGFIIGKRPKKKKENAYADLGKKQCLGKCARILPFECFGKDKSRPDGYASSCKECRCKNAKLKYKESKN